MQTRCLKLKLKPNSLDLVYAWADRLNMSKDEVLISLTNEDVIS